MEVTEKIKCPLENRIVVVKPIIRPDQFFMEINTKHDALGGYTGAKKTFCVPIDALTNHIKDPLTEEERLWFESKDCPLGFKPGDLSPVRESKLNFWSSVTNEVILTKEGASYNLNNPVEYLKYVVLRVNKNTIAPSWNERFNRGTYVYALCDENEEIKGKISDMELMKETWKEFGIIYESKNKLYDFLCVNYLTSKKKNLKKPSYNSSLDQLKTQVSDIIEKDKEFFLSIIKDKNYNTKVLISKAVLLGEITSIDKGNRYHIKSIDFKGTMNELVTYLNDVKYQSDRVRLIGIVKNEETEKEK